MFWAYNKTTQQNVISINPDLSEEFYKNEQWQIHPSFIETNPNNIPIEDIPIYWRKGKENIINYQGTIYNIRPHFYIPNQEKLGINLKKDLETHTQCVNFICNLLHENKINILSHKEKEKSKIIQLDSSLFDFNKISTETTTTSDYGVRADILLPLKKFHEVYGFGIIFEIQLTPESEKKEIERSFQRATHYYSVCWLKPEDFEDIKNLNLQLKEDSVYIKNYISILKNFKEKEVSEIKELTLNYSILINEKLEEFKKLASEINYVPRPCSECEGLLTVKEGKFGKFYGCSNYPTCTKTIRLYSIKR